MNIKKEAFIKKYAEIIKNGKAAIFAGAGLSVESGFPTWAGLIQKMADELNLDKNAMPDYTTIAQYYENEFHRHQLIQLIKKDIPNDFSPNAKHNLLASLPIKTYWTTNYDHLIEEAMRDAKKQYEPIKQQEGISQVNNVDKVVIYKMHGDIDYPTDIVITKEDYEKYEDKHHMYIQILSGDLLKRTFLFIGFSFDDHNFAIILSKIRNVLNKNTPTHFCIIKAPNNGSIDQFDHKINELKRMFIHPIIVNDYDEINEILRLLNNRVNYKTITITENDELKVTFDINEEQAIYTINGRSNFEDVRSTFKPLIDHFANYRKEPVKKTKIIFDLTHICSSTKLYFKSFLKVVDEYLFKKGFDVSIKWYYEDEDDEDHKDDGKTILTIFDMPYELISRNFESHPDL